MYWIFVINSMRDYTLSEQPEEISSWIFSITKGCIRQTNTKLKLSLKNGSELNYRYFYTYFDFPEIISGNFSNCLRSWLTKEFKKEISNWAIQLWLKLL